MNKRFLLRSLFVLIGLGTLLLAALIPLTAMGKTGDNPKDGSPSQGPAGNGSDSAVGGPVSSAAVLSAVQDYWTPERMANARPADMPKPSGLPPQGSATGPATIAPSGPAISVDGGGPGHP